MARKDYSITYEKIKSYEFEEYSFDDYQSWYAHTISQLSKLQKRNKDGSLHNVYQGIGDYLEELLAAAMRKRFEQKNKDNPYDLFKDVVGEYLINIEDMVTIKDQMLLLEQMVDIFNGVKSLTSIDPSPQKKKKTVELIEDDKDLENVILDVAYGQIVKYEREIPNFKSVIGQIMGKYPQYREDPTMVREIAEKMVEQANSEFIKNGIEEIRKRVKNENKRETEKVKPITELNIEYYFAMGDYKPEVIYYEIEGDERQISIQALIRKVKDKKIQEELNRIRPNGPEWPISSTGNYYLIITNDPMMIVTMSTARPWASTSCMRANGPYNRGPFHDVELGNPVTFVLTADTINEGWPTIYDDTLKGRNLMKWGLRDNIPDDYAVGFESTTYPSGREWGIPMATALGMILTDRGYMGYTNCRTPYRYKGWSDLMGATNVQITYTGINLYGRKINLEESQFAPEIAMAQSPTTVYSQMNRLTRLSVDVRIKRAVAQNPNIWMYETALGRLIRTKDLDVYRQLVNSPIAIPEALLEMGLVIEEVDSRVGGRDWENYPHNSLIYDLIKHPNTPLELHQHYVEKYGKPFISWAYAQTSGPCYAPLELLDEVIDNIYNDDDKMYPEEYLKSFRALIYAPHMDEEKFIKLMNRYYNYRSKRNAMKGSMFSPAEVAVNDEIENLFAFRVLMPFHEGENGWAFKGDYLGIPTSTNNIEPSWRHNYINIASVEVVALLVEIVPQILSNSDRFNGCMMFENLREWEVGDYLWDKRTKLKISLEHFINRPRSPTDIMKPISHLLIPAKRLGTVFNNLKHADISKIKYDFLPEVSEHRIERETISRNLLKKILTNPEQIMEIGIAPIAMWLLTPSQFDDYVSTIMGIALGGLWNEGKLLDPPEDYFDFYNMIENIGIMSEAAIGLAKNPRVPEQIQNDLIGSWLEISNKYEGTYNEKISIIEGLLAVNPNVSKNVINKLIHNDNYRQLFAKNPNCPQSYLTGHKAGGREASLFYQYPVEVLCNPGLSNDNFDRLWTLLDKYLRTEVEADAERLFNRLASFKSILNIDKGVTKRKYIRDKILQGDDVSNWINYWRGGNSKGTKYSNHQRKNMFTEVGGITDYPMAPIGHKSVVLFFEDGDVDNNSLWFIKKMEDGGDGMLKIDAKITKYVDGQLQEETYKGTQHVNEFFRFIPPEDNL